MSTYVEYVARIAELQKKMLELNYQLGGDASIQEIASIAIDNIDVDTVVAIATDWRKCFSAEQCELLDQFADIARAMIKKRNEDPVQRAELMELAPVMIPALEEMLQLAEQRIAQREMLATAGSKLH